MSDKIAHAVVHLGANKMEVVVKRGKKPRKVVVTWSCKEPTDVPPAAWPLMVACELNFQDSNPMPPGVL